MAFSLKTVLTELTDGLGLAYWVIVKTKDPECQYYFGPFLTEAEAEQHRVGYINDLEGEGAAIQEVAIERCRKPASLTLDPLETES
ncbi:MAG: DUF1816 domain-containing protein [Cyanobacteria bacterium J06642_2]